MKITVMMHVAFPVLFYNGPRYEYEFCCYKPNILYQNYSSNFYKCHKCTLGACQNLCESYGQIDPVP